MSDRRSLIDRLDWADNWGNLFSVTPMGYRSESMMGYNKPEKTYYIVFDARKPLPLKPGIYKLGICCIILEKKKENIS